MTGAIAVFGSGRLMQIHDMPCFDGRVDGIELGGILDGVDIVYLENTHPMPKNGSISSFKLGLNTGIVIGVVQSLAIPLVRIPVTAWRGYNGLHGKPKEASLGLARELFPEHKAMLTRQRDHNRAEAALIGRYGVYRQIHERKADDEGENTARTAGNGAVREGGGSDRGAAGAAPGDQRPAQGSRRRGDRVAQVHALVRPIEDPDYDRGSSR